ncbi:undecaprenyl/decaprenyl-phosphate alpha-N-acetylglucosaminyl 1-phosphate transferase [Patescibacteria group bacterium]|nr:undecaprenyl/decaprenyl-phosphate alpha-N-acetylglucosaminyl 1-phosphate transferase [Patescibacteria group bacterium]
MDNLLLIKYYLLPFVFSFMIAVMLTAIIRALAFKLKIFDYPTEPRKIHDKPIPELGGLAIFLTFALVALIYHQSGLLVDGKIELRFVTGFLVGGLILMIGGFLDDKFKLKPCQSFIFPVSAALTVIFGGLEIGYITNPLGGLLYLGGTIWSPLLIFFWLIGMMYTTKFLDGLDGLVSGVAVIGSIILFLVSLFWDKPLSGTSILCLILGGSALGFLIWNFHPAKIFLGEGGSLFLGFMLGVLAIISGAKIATALLIMGIPILDVVWVIVRRLFKEKKSPFLADKKHLHFRLLDAGLNQRQAVLFLYLLTLLFGASAIFQQTLGKLITMGILVVVMLLLAWWVIARYKKRNYDQG